MRYIEGVDLYTIGTSDPYVTCGICGDNAGFPHLQTIHAFFEVDFTATNDMWYTKLRVMR